MGSRGTPARNEGERSQNSGGGISRRGRARETLTIYSDCGLVDSPANRQRAASVIRHIVRKIVPGSHLWEDRHPDHARGRTHHSQCAVVWRVEQTSTTRTRRIKPACFLFYPLHGFQQPSLVVDTLVDDLSGQTGIAASSSLSVRKNGRGIRRARSWRWRLPLRA